MAEQYESVDLVDDQTVRYFTVAVLVAALTAALAQISIPVPGYPAPFSLQPFGAYIAGLLLGPVWGGFSLLVYILAGVVGAPVFSNGAAGLGYLLVGRGTGGFLVGFLVAAVFIGAITHRGVEPKSLSEVPVSTQVVALGVGLVVIYAIGVPWMAYVLGFSIPKAGAIMLPYVPLDAVKLGVVVALVRGEGLLGESSDIL